MYINLGGFSMLAKIQKWGNSQGLRLDKHLLQNANISVGDAVDIAAKDGIIIVERIRKRHGRHNLEELVAKIPKNYKASEVDWGEASGKEVW
jgi:antitoxin MazE